MFCSFSVDLVEKGSEEKTLVVGMFALSLLSSPDFLAPRSLLVNFSVSHTQVSVMAECQNEVRTSGFIPSCYAASIPLDKLREGILLR